MYCGTTQGSRVDTINGQGLLFGYLRAFIGVYEFAHRQTFVCLWEVIVCCSSIYGGGITYLGRGGITKGSIF